MGEIPLIRRYAAPPGIGHRMVRRSPIYRYTPGIRRYPAPPGMEHRMARGIAFQSRIASRCRRGVALLPAFRLDRIRRSQHGLFLGRIDMAQEPHDVVGKAEADDIMHGVIQAVVGPVREQREETA